MKRVFILGAGASRFAGYPLGADLWAFVKKHSVGADFIANKRREAVVRCVDSIIERYVTPTEYDRPNLEEIFTYLDLSILGSSLITLDGMDWKRTRLNAMAVMADAFQWYQYDLQKIWSNASVRSTLESWAEFLRGGDVVITYNWDLLHEAALFQANKWHFFRRLWLSLRRFRTGCPFSRHDPKAAWLSELDSGQ